MAARAACDDLSNDFFASINLHGVEIKQASRRSVFLYAAIAARGEGLPHAGLFQGSLNCALDSSGGLRGVLGLFLILGDSNGR